MEWRALQDPHRTEPYIVGSNEAVFHFALPSGNSQPVASAVEVAVTAGLHLILFQQVDNLLASVSLIEGWVVEKAQLVSFPRGF